jgi:phosphohistidine phosphatase
MSRELFIMRHAKSAWNSDAPTDFERPLNKRGKQDASLIGAWLRSQGLMPDFVISSPAKRARKTTLKVCRELGIPKNQIRWQDDIYEASTSHLLEILASCPEKADPVLLVGHNPGLEALTLYLCGPDLPTNEDGKLLTTAALARVRLPTDWQALEPGVGQLLAIVRPRTLRDPSS